MTPLQQAAQALIDRWNSPVPMPTGTLIAELRKALDAELQQSVEPVAWLIESDYVTRSSSIAKDWGLKGVEVRALYLYPPQPQLRECWYESDELKVCRKCGQLHDKAITPPQQVAVHGLHKLIEGMTVSIDVSTGDHDAGNRLFGVVNEVMESSGDKNGLTLLVYETTPNFKQAQKAKPKTMGDVQEMCIAALQREERGELANKLRDIGYPECCDAADMLEADVSLINEGNKAQQAKQDKARLDWLEQNLFNRENLTLQGKVCNDYNMWVMFSPVGVQGSARTIIDAAMKEGKP